jgi:hypothetical protein
MPLRLRRVVPPVTRGTAAGRHARCCRALAAGPARGTARTRTTVSSLTFPPLKVSGPAGFASAILSAFSPVARWVPI